MIKINLLAEKKQSKKKKRVGAGLNVEALGKGQNILLGLILVIGAAVTGVWWFQLSGEVADWKQRHADADAELERLTEIRKKGEEYKTQKELLAQKIDLITELKKRQDVPAHILDQVSKNLPEFLWLDQLTADDSKISITGKATTYNAVTNFYNNLARSGLFSDVSLGRTFEASEGVAFSLSCSWGALVADGEEEETQS